MEVKVKIETQDEAQAVFGPQDEYLKLLEKEFKVKFVLRGGYLKISGIGHNARKAAKVVEAVLSAHRSGVEQLSRAELYCLMRELKDEASFELSRPQYLPSTPQPVGSIKQIGPRTKGQREYTEAIKKYDIVFGVGPAGTGKTYLAMAAAVEALKKQQVRRIILTRPAIEAGESLGFLPGDMHEKISPYLRPLTDAIYDMMDAEVIEKYMETGIIEIAPLAYMRGRTLNDAFIIMDEAQNATVEQMKMFLTRIGFDSKAVITGDSTQSDLPNSRPIGLIQAENILQDIEGIKFVYLTGADVVRHALVQKIIEAYGKASGNK